MRSVLTISACPAPALLHSIQLSARDKTSAPQTTPSTVSQVAHLHTCIVAVLIVLSYSVGPGAVPYSQLPMNVCVCVCVCSEEQGRAGVAWTSVADNSDCGMLTDHCWHPGGSADQCGEEEEGHHVVP